MQRDLKIGLSLAVLLAGVAGAFVFRRQPNAESPPASIESAEELDELIAGKERKPYLTGIESDDIAAGKAGGRRGALRQSPPKFDLEAFVSDDADKFGNHPTAGKTNKGEMSTADRAGVHPGQQILEEDEPFAPQQRAAADVAVRGNGSTPFQPHVIRPGDTLSNLAAYYYRDKSRFEEIYQANRNVIPNRNRLPVGTTIRIPGTSVNPAPAMTLKPSSQHQATTQRDRPRGSVTGISTDRTFEIHPAAGSGNSSAEPPRESDPRKAQKDQGKSGVRFSGAKTLPLNPAKGGRTYVVRRGDSLDKIAVEVYGSAAKARAIFDTNRDQLASPNAVREGMRLVLP